MHLLQVLYLGRLDYATALRLQETLAGLRKQGRIADTLLLLEHPPVITLGRNAKLNHVVATPELLRERGVEVHEINRGGDVTFHGPGQLVGYPIIDLRMLPPTSEGKRVGVIEFVRRLEELLIRALADFGIAAGRSAGQTGVWTVEYASASGGEKIQEDMDGKRHPGSGGGKLAAIGVHISRGVTTHGFALNVTSDLEGFRLIVPCGIADKPVTSMEREVPAQTAKRLELENVAQAVTRQFGNVFGMQVLWLESLGQMVQGEGREMGGGTPQDGDGGGSDADGEGDGSGDENRPPEDDRLREPEELKRMREERERAPSGDVHWA